MTSPKAKRLILGCLVILLCVVWWRSLRVMNIQSAALPPSATANSLTPPQTKRSIQLPYNPPRYNPFVANAAQPATTKSTGRIVAPPPPFPQVQLIGCLPGKVPQAILRTASGSDIIATKGDTISSWTLKTISDSYVVLSNGNRSDTLRIGHGL